MIDNNGFNLWADGYFAMRILIAEDEVELAKGLKFLLEKKRGFMVYSHKSLFVSLFF